MHHMTLAEIARGLADKKFSSEELTKTLLARIAELDPKVNSFISLTEELALSQAKAADARRANGEQGALLGAPIAHKDLFCTQGIRTSCGSKMLDNFKAPYDATVVAKLAAAGAVTLGKTNMDEFAMGSANESSYYGAVKNPWNLEHVPGGSSGGSAAAVAARLLPAATATDTGGSIRQPAAFTNLTGLKPTYGRVSRWGMIAYASSLDQGGPLARTAEDCAILLQGMAGFDANDSTSIDEPVPDYSASLNGSLQGLRIGVPKEYFIEGTDPEVMALVRAAIDRCEKAGAAVREISLPHTEYAIAVYYICATAEASANLARFDGVRYGRRRGDAAGGLQAMYDRTRTDGFGKEVKRRIILGTYVLSSGYYDAYYNRALKARTLIRRDFEAAFQTCDVLMMPVSPTTAYKLNSTVNDPLKSYLGDIFTVPANLAGICGMSVPCGKTSEGLPVGLQILGPAFGEVAMLRAGQAVEAFQAGR